MESLRTIGFFVIAIVTGVITGGCGPRLKTKVIEVKVDPVNEARSMLQAYAAGQSVGSEASAYDDLTSRLKAADPVKGEAFATFVEETRKSTSDVASRAKKLLAGF